MKKKNNHPKTVIVRLSDDLHQYLEAQAEAQDTTVSKLLRKMIADDKTVTEKSVSYE